METIIDLLQREWFLTLVNKGNINWVEWEPIHIKIGYWSYVILKKTKRHKKWRNFTPYSGEQAGIYAWFCLDSKLWYIGKSYDLKTRFRQHWRNLRNKMKGLPVVETKYAKLKQIGYKFIFYIIEKHDVRMRKRKNGPWDRNLAVAERRCINYHRPALNMCKYAHGNTKKLNNKRIKIKQKIKNKGQIKKTFNPKPTAFYIKQKISPSEVTYVKAVNLKHLVELKKNNQEKFEVIILKGSACKSKANYKKYQTLYCINAKKQIITLKKQLRKMKPNEMEKVKILHRLPRRKTLHQKIAESMVKYKKPLWKAATWALADLYKATKFCKGKERSIQRRKVNRVIKYRYGFWLNKQYKIKIFHSSKEITRILKNIIKKSIHVNTYTNQEIILEKGKMKIRTPQKLGNLAQKIKVNIYHKKTPSISDILSNQREWSRKFKLNNPFKCQ